MINVLIVEDSPVAQEFLKYVLSSDPAIHIMGVAGNGAEALEAVRRNKPDVITMDIHMPLMDGFEATRQIMATVPVPIVIVSGSTGATELDGTFQAIEAGALAVVRRPPGMNHNAFETGARELIQTVKLMSEVKVVRRTSYAVRTDAPPFPASFPQPGKNADIRIAAIGASTGGPPVLQRILSGLPPDFPVPVLIVQHIASGFIHGFAEWLSGASGFPVAIARQGEHLLPGRAYVPPDDVHLGVDGDLRVELSGEAPENNLRPSVDHLFRSVARAAGPAAAGVLLTGMGRDGARELKTMRDAGAVTMVQDRESSVVYGMPGEAVGIGAATHILSPDDIAAMLISLVTEKHRSSR